MRGALLSLLWVACATPALAQAPVTYRVSIPEPEHHWMQVEAVFPDLPPGPVQILMSRSSPGRYALHEFAKNVYDVQVDDGSGHAIATERPTQDEWRVPKQSGTVRVRYKVFGNTSDGTYLGVDTSHAHINIPSVLMWARGLDMRPARIVFVPPQGLSWRVATQLHPTNDQYTFTAPNLFYLIDSPVEMSNFTLRTFVVDQQFRIALHHDGTDREADRFATDVERIVKEARAVFGELPSYEGGYTFLIDVLPHVTWDGMEHRNSVVLTVPGALRVADQRMNVLSTVAHEFMHGWNVERIRPKGLEPFKLDAVNTTGELWFAEGFTNYYESLIMTRTGLTTAADFAATNGMVLNTVINSPARPGRSAEDMSRLAPFTDGAAWVDRTNWDNRVISYYTWGAAIALALELSLRDRTGGKVTLDDFMRAVWREFGRPPSPVEGVVARPYTMQDLKNVLGEVAGDRAFAEQFFAKYVQGHDVADYQTLVARAGFVLRKRYPQRAWIGPVALRVVRGSAVVTAPTWEGTPAYISGLDQDDEILSFDGETLSSAEHIDEIVQRHKSGDKIRVVVRRHGVSEPLMITVEADPTLELLAAESSGRSLTAQERAFRDAWLTSRQ